MTAYEPEAGFNMPAGCFDVPDPFMVCDECRWSYREGEDGTMYCKVHLIQVYEDWICKDWRQG